MGAKIAMDSAMVAAEPADGVSQGVGESLLGTGATQTRCDRTCPSGSRARADCSPPQSAKGLRHEARAHDRDAGPQRFTTRLRSTAWSQASSEPADVVQVDLELAG